MKEKALAAMSRRRFISLSAMSLATLSSSYALVMQRTANAQQSGLEKLEETDSLAQAFNYHHNAEEVAEGARGDNQYCYNCQFYQGQEGEEWGPCTIFPNKLVSANGWCSAWAQKAS